MLARRDHLELYFCTEISRPPRRGRHTGCRWLAAALGIAAVFPAPLAAQPPSAKQDQGAAVAKAASPFREAESLLLQGQIVAAREKIQEQLKLHPSSVEGFNLLGISYSDEKDYADASEAFQHALKLDPNSTRTLNNLGSLDATQGNPNLAEQEFRKVLRLAPANRDGHYNLGLLLLAKGAPAEALAHFQRVRPLTTGVRFALTRACLEAGQISQGLKTAEEISAQAGSDANLHSALGVLLGSEKRYAAAERELERANSLQPESFEILYNLGQIYLRDAKYTNAELELNRALKLKPESAETLYLLGQADSEQNRLVDAMDLLLRAHKFAPENTDVIFLLARLGMKQNYYEDAIPLLESGIAIAPQRADLHAALGESYFMSGKTETAIAEFQKLIDLDPSAASYAFMGLSYRHLGRFEEAQKYFAEGLKKNPRNVSCLFNLGFIEERRGNNARAEELFREVLQISPGFPDALLELANLRITNKQFEQAIPLLRKYVSVSSDPGTGYYKLALAERSLHQTVAAQRDLSVFQTLSKNAPTGPYPYEHLFDYLGNRSNLAPEARTQLDLTTLTDEIRSHPDQPQDLYLLAESYLKLGRLDEAKSVVTELDQISAGDYRTQAGIGALLARFHLYDDASRHFETALAANPDSDEVKFDLADAYFRKARYAEALTTAREVSQTGQKDDSYLSLLGDIQLRLGNTAQATEIFRSAIQRNPDADQYYLSLALAELRQNDVPAANETLQRGAARIPASGKILWGLGIVSVLEGRNEEAAVRFERAVDLLPEWPGGYSALGIFYFQTGDIAKARDVLNRFKGSGVTGGLDLNRIEQTLANAPQSTKPSQEPMSTAARYQFLQLALSLADRTL
ncbi:MAG: tetratricopeptide repeat protein [Candidatus Acidiferrum sp.]